MGAAPGQRWTTPLAWSTPSVSDTSAIARRGGLASRRWITTGTNVACEFDAPCGRYGAVRERSSRASSQLGNRSDRCSRYRSSCPEICRLSCWNRAGKIFQLLHVDPYQARADAIASQAATRDVPADCPDRDVGVCGRRSKAHKLTASGCRVRTGTSTRTSVARVRLRVGPSWGRGRPRGRGRHLGISPSTLATQRPRVICTTRPAAAWACSRE